MATIRKRHLRLATWKLPDEPTRDLPYSAEAEQLLLGALLLSHLSWDQVVDKVGESDFYDRRHRIIFKHILEAIQARLPCNVESVYRSIEERKEGEITGGLAYLRNLVELVQGAADVRAYAQVVREYAIRREIVVFCEATIRNARHVI